jgi:hypothetical protein
MAHAKRSRPIITDQSSIWIAGLFDRHSRPEIREMKIQDGTFAHEDSRADSAERRTIRDLGRVRFRQPDLEL